MTEALQVHEPLLVNALGHAAGALVFAIFLGLLVRHRAGNRVAGIRLSISAAALAVVWNSASLVLLGLGGEPSAAARAAAATGYSAISLLPAVLFNLLLGRHHRGAVRTGYSLSGAAILLHLSELVYPTAHSHRLGLIVVTLGFGVLTALAAARVLRSGKTGRRLLTSRIVGTMSLFFFAISLEHLGTQPHAPWPVELALHHAGIPLALFVLLQDFRFVLLDAFIRFLANVLLAGGVTFVATRLAVWLGLLPPAPPGPVREAILLTGASALLVLFAVFRSTLQRLLTRIVFPRPDLEARLQELREAAAKATEVEAYLAWASRRIADFMNAEPMEDPDAQLVERLGRLALLGPATVALTGELRAQMELAGIEVVAPLRLSRTEARFILLGRRRGGRPYLSEDLDMLARLSAQVVEAVERYREAEMKRLVAQAELRALQSQIHPHFLFNALNTLYGVIPKEAAGARRTVLNLADIFRYFLRTDRTYIPLREEMEIVRAYLEIESLRLGPKLRTTVSADEKALDLPIPVLSIQPLVENAVKHGVAARAEGGEVRVSASMEDRGLRVVVEDTGKGFARQGQPGGVGLDNVVRRLHLCYGPEARISIESWAGGARVGFTAPVSARVESAG